MTSTIAAVASARGPARRAVLRISGPRAKAIAAASCRVRPGGGALALSARAAFDVDFDDGVGRLPAMLLWMPGPRSFTAEDVVELHLPGHPELVDGALARVFELGAVLAEPGEFTRRAFENGRIDLTRAEGVLALVGARSREERRAAAALLAGGLERRLRAIRDELEAVRALAEASLDFDEADTGHVPLDVIEAMGRGARERVEEALGWERSRVSRGSALRVVLAGAPNAGKSTLFNRLASGATREASGAALVSDLEGTTRDAKHGEWVLAGGVVCDLYDTAGRHGWSSSDSEGAAPQDLGGDPDRIASERAAALVRSADAIVWVVDASAGAEQPAAPGEAQRVVLAWNKVDAPGARPAPPAAWTSLVAAHVPVSAALGAGLEDLGDTLANLLAGEPVEELQDGAGGLGLGARHLAALEEALRRLSEGLGLAASRAPLDLVAEELRAATDSLDGIVGRTTPEDLLDRIFAQFCLGK